MNDPVTYLLIIDKLTRSFYENFNVGNYQRAHEIAIDMTDISQQLEDVMKKMRDAKFN
jgi:hypothetical protein